MIELFLCAVVLFTVGLVLGRRQRRFPPGGGRARALLAATRMGADLNIGEWHLFRQSNGGWMVARVDGLRGEDERRFSESERAGAVAYFMEVAGLHESPETV